MIGEKVIFKVRMSADDAHYAGELVNGAKLLVYWGDVGTELMIRTDGDESLFAGYESVEFTAPVFAGDFLEYHGWVEKMGNTSRKCMFEAYKVIELCRDPNLEHSAARVLEKPLLVGRATGTLVVPKHAQRGVQDPKFAVK